MRRNGEGVTLGVMGMAFGQGISPIAALVLAVIASAARPASAQDAPTSAPPDGASAPPPGEPDEHAAPSVPDLMPGRVLASVAGLEDDLGPIDSAQAAVHDAEERLVDGQRRDAIQHGVVAPFYRELQRSLREGFHPDLAAIADARRAGQTPLQIIVDELSRYGPPEPPRDARGTPTPEMRGRTPEEIQLLNSFDTQSLLNAHTNWTAVEIHVEQDRDGSITRTRVTHSSGSRLLDRAALDAVRDAVVQRPPDALVGTRSGVTSDWIFWAGEVVPFIGAMTQGGLTGMTLGVSCMDGPTGDGVQCSAAGRPLLRTRVELIDVHDATYEHARMALPTPPAEPASALGDPAAAPEPPPR